ncbi:dihydrolipoyl dehydrogenase [Sulfuricurvum sp.]|uniref:dihydrolipoyl dehydrogenase n=1 Tax=Sulfuricurvum sp. TaxID=2025608 RepID=UPI003C478701
MREFDAVVIGAGPGGYEAALQLALGGIKTLLIDRSKEHIGGVCLNEGCIPAKAYLQSADYLSKASYFKECGIEMEIKGADIRKMKEKTRLLKNELRSGVVWQLEQAGVEMMYGSASFVDSYTIEVSGERIGFQKCIIATGGKVRETALLPLDGKRILSSGDIFEQESLPSSIAIVGGGAIGCEFATFFRALGVEVTLIVRGSQLLSGEDEDIAKALLRAFKKSGIRVLTSTAVQKAEVCDNGVELSLKSADQERIRYEWVLVAIGRDPNTEGLNLENAGIKQNEKGFIEVNGAFQTIQKHIFSVGDCINTPAYAHTAYAEARIAACNIISGGMDGNAHISPSAVFSNPPIASCGLREREAKEQGREIEVKKAFFKVNSKAKILGDDSGFVKIIVDSKDSVIVGASIIGVESTEIIHELVLAVEKKHTYHQMKEMIHIHPSVSEILKYI